MIVDAHCDTITRIMEKEEGLYRNSGHVDLERLKKYSSFLQFFAAFIHPVYRHGGEMRRAIQIIDRLMEEIRVNEAHVSFCTNSSEMEEAFQMGKVAAFLSIEGGEALQGEISALRAFYKLGVRSICLTWNHRNEIADGVADALTGGGLTPFGRDVIHEMNKLGMLIDVSHLCEKAFWDVLENTNQPIIASHSNAKALCGHRRNLTDDQIRALRDNGGVMGMNLYPSFLHDSEKASMKDVIKHIEHIVSLIGEDHIGLGADFDGIEICPNDILGVQDMACLFNELAKLNYTQSFINKLSGKNFLRVIRQVCG